MDVGAVSVSAVEVGFDGEVLRTFYELHHGEIESTLSDVLGRLDLSRIGTLASTTSTPSFIQVDRCYDNQICLITAARRFFPLARSILVVGGERFGLVRFDENGRYLSFRSNPLCAAGTGSFLDQQARRLNLKSTQALATLALANTETPPKIASRCAVFAKTDLVHAQQEGHQLEAICDGLCLGVAKNIVDTLFKGATILGPILVVGGVARNDAVVRHLRALMAQELIVEEELPVGAAGAALRALEGLTIAESGRVADSEYPGDRGRARADAGRTIAQVFNRQPAIRTYEFEPLALRLSDYPDFASLERSLFYGQVVKHSEPLEVDVYRKLSPAVPAHPLYLGIDVGSTSTKAVVTDLDGNVVAGFYTATAGRPLDAVQLILEAVADWQDREELSFRWLGVASTGAGRKYIGKIVRADLVLDEITAHARAAVELHPGVDTILEIGGQDSKFTTLRDGRVTLSVMNNVCAAGTGSFIEEQARRLDVPLEEYGSRTEGCSSPLASERCTVFMERDLNHYTSEGYAQSEVLAAVLHSVRENYLNKVAVPSAIGDTVAFQGATARNKALVAAFEQRLGKPILVSRFCHLAGALGAALTMKDEGVRQSMFRGLGMHRKKIPIRNEVCELCTNHCKLSVAEVQGDTVAYGFLCGRDYETQKHVKANTSGFDLLKERKRAFREVKRAKPLPIMQRVAAAVRGGAATADSSVATHDRGAVNTEPVVTDADAVGTADVRSKFTIGIPAALHLFEDLSLWKHFFRRLGMRVVSSERYRDAVKHGRALAGAEFCAPLTAFHAHVRYLQERCDVVFLPIFLEKKSPHKTGRRQYCYYTQFAPSLGAALAEGRVLSPLVHSLYTPLFTKAELYRTLRTVVPGGVSFFEVSSAYEEAVGANEQALARLRDVYLQRVERSPPPETLGTERQGESQGGNLHVVLLGRPYTILPESMNKRIPQIFAALGIPVFFQDMLSYSQEDVEELGPLLEEVHWNYAAKILEAAEICARTPGAYPVFVTSFKCSPDSFLTEYFRQIVESHGKPYLILQLDEHDSRLGYETRIEAAVRAFRNHHGAVHSSVSRLNPPMPTAVQAQPQLAPCITGAFKEGTGGADLANKTILFPNWDSLSLRLVVATLRRRGMDARLLEGTEGSIRRSLRHNSGQCTPLNIIAQDFMEYVRRHDLDPAESVLWTAASSIACNIRLYPHHIRTILESHGGGFERSKVYVGAISLKDISATLPLDVYQAYMFGGFIRRIGCRVRPYEKRRGETDRAIEEGMEQMVEAFQGDRPKEDVLARVVSRLDAIACAQGNPRPEVAIFGDLYSRDNDVLNQDLIRFIEDHGGEVITTPYTSYVKMVVRPYYWKWFWEGKYMNVLSAGALMAAVGPLEKKYFPYFEQVLGGLEPVYDASPQAVLSAYNVRVEHTGESMDNLLKIFYTSRHHPEVALFVQASPAFCCPSLITEAMAQEIETQTGVPIVSVTYDGTGGGKNEVILPYLEYPRGRGGEARRLRTA
jgi:predicted CoA-substrate-specific enzyme activase